MKKLLLVLTLAFCGMAHATNYTTVAGYLTAELNAKNGISDTIYRFYQNGDKLTMSWAFNGQIQMASYDRDGSNFSNRTTAANVSQISFFKIEESNHRIIEYRAHSLTAAPNFADTENTIVYSW
ncbi:hypothetical protein HT819_003911 [Salmonella enterica]|nr:hypothetical protein [Salmonella enterica]